MDFISNREPQNKKMLEIIGVQSVEELFESIPRFLLLKKPQFDDGLSEFEGLKLMESIAAKNSFPQFDNYLGAGAYEHHVPALVNAICSKSEFLTSYTPYQPEASQGMLQIIFEFQSAICALTGLDVANASLYDGASACAEACLMAIRCQKRHHILLADSVHPHYQSAVKQYLKGFNSNIEIIPFLQNGQTNLDKLKKLCNENTAAILIQYPNFFGCIDEIKQISAIAKSTGALLILCANPLVYGIYADAKQLNADIAVGDCQPFGLPLQFGGPYAGYIACKQEFVRQLPGRIAGETVDLKGNRGFVLTLQAREQHIRREKATSNICTNQALAALASLVSILWYGRKGVAALALTNYQRTAYLRSLLKEKGLELVFEYTPFFNEFVVKFPIPLSKVQKIFRDEKIEPGLDLGRFYPQFKDCLLVAVTETKNKEQLERYSEVARRCIYEK